jgi:hypothetical protein
MKGDLPSTFHPTKSLLLHPSQRFLACLRASADTPAEVLGIRLTVVGKGKQVGRN